MTSSPGVAPRRTVRRIHFARAGVAVVACSTLVLVPQRGHPPPMALVPAVLPVWLTGHVVIWTLSWLHGKGPGATPSPGGASRRWPLALVVALVGTGAGAGVGLLQLLGSALSRRWYPYPDPALWLTSFLACAAHAACLAGLLPRRPWARTLRALVALGWAVVLGTQWVEHAASPASLASPDKLLAIGLLALFVALAGHLLVSRSVKAFFER